MADHVIDIAYRKGYDSGLTSSANKVKEVFNELPGNAESSVRDLLLDLYNDIVSSCSTE